MDKRVLENILTDQKEELELKRSLHFYERKEEDEIDLESTQAQVIIGVRRSGKSTLCYNALTKKNIKFAYVNFDDERLIRLTSEDLNDVLEVLYKINGDFNYFFIDEIQNIEGWYLFVNRLLRRGMHIIITGSNAKLLSGELASHLTGRHHSIALYPFSFAEYCDFHNIDKNSQSTKAIANRRAAFDNFLKQGGFPELQMIKNHHGYINELVNNILERDIVQRFNIRHTATFQQLAHHLLNMAPSIVAHPTLQETFELKSQHTTKNYLNYLKQTYLLIGIHKYSSKSRVRLIEEKVYPVDVALMNNREDAFVGENLGWRLETLVFHELIRKYKVTGHDIYYYRERGGECDFVVCLGRKVIVLVQVSYDITSPKTLKRELAGLILAAKKTNCQNLLLITDNVNTDILHNGYNIAVRPAFDYFLQRF